MTESPAHLTCTVPHSHVFAGIFGKTRALGPLSNRMCSEPRVGTDNSIDRAVKPAAEFKFSCPVCHQHIAAGAESAGTEIECPTCFRPIMVPRSPGNATTKLILRGRQAG